MKVSEIIEALSPEAREVLERMPSDKIGTVVPPGHLAELDDFGLVGQNYGLTIKGSAVVCMIKPDVEF